MLTVIKTTLYVFIFITALTALVVIGGIILGGVMMLIGLRMPSDAIRAETVQVGAVELLKFILVVGGFFVILYWYLSWRYTVYAATTKRIIRRSGIIGRDIFETPLAKVQDFRVKIGILQRLFNCGTLVITTAGTAGVECKWSDINDPMGVRNLLNELLVD